MEIGQILKEAREAKNMTLDELQEKTKIQKRYLMAIEENKFHALPGRFYARAFIKEYALMVDLDADLLLQHFDADHIPKKEPVQYNTLKRTRRSREQKSSTIFSVLPTVIVVLLIVGILVVAWALTQKAFTTNQTNQNQDQEGDEIIRNIDEPAEPVLPENDDDLEGDNDETTDEPSTETQSSFTLIEEGTGNSPESTFDFEYYEEELIVTFEVSADSYVAITGGNGTKYFDGLLSPSVQSEPIDITGEETVHFNIGNTSGLTVKINDIPVEYPISPSERVHQKLLINLNKATN